MLNDKLCLTSVLEFLHRGRVDRGTGEGKVVVVVDSSKRKVRATSAFTGGVSRYKPFRWEHVWVSTSRCNPSLHQSFCALPETILPQ